MTKERGGAETLNVRDKIWGIYLETLAKIRAFFVGKESKEVAERVLSELAGGEKKHSLYQRTESFGLKNVPEDLEYYENGGRYVGVEGSQGVPILLSGMRKDKGRSIGKGRLY